MNTEITNAVNAAGDKAQYDARVKRILAQKNILAHILVKTVDEFKGMKPEDVVTYIEGEPKVGIVPVEPGLTNAENTGATGQRIVGITNNIPISNELREDVRIMCNLSIGIEEKATEKFILNMYKKGYTLDQIADVAETSVEVVDAIIKKKEPAMA